MKTMRCLVTENARNLWLKQWVFYSLKAQLAGSGLPVEHLRHLTQVLPTQPLIISISGAQGSGKSSLAAALQQLWLTLGIQSDIVSLDDYYLEPAQRQERSKLWHPLFAERGVPGTHDTELLLSQLQAFKRGEPQYWRRYDKGMDRAVIEPHATPARLLIFEGWCVGLAAQADAALVPSINALEHQQDPDVLWRRKVNEQLAGDYQQIWQASDSLVWLNAPDWQAICRWREWQEQALQVQGKGKSLAELEHFMLYFQRLTQESWRQLPDRADFILTLDQQHRFVSLTPDE
jgi:D-glycerate 3-kinase